ncbi:MAG: ABC transporter substrate-binding protein [bacterium]
MAKKLIIFYFLFFFFYSLFSLFLFYNPVEASQKVLVVKSAELKPYAEVLKGFRETCICDIETLIISELISPDLRKNLPGIKPDIALAIGKNALSWIKDVKDIPIIYLMVLNPQPELSGHDNIKGINMYISPGEQLSIFKEVTPDVKNIGILTDPAKTGHIVKMAQDSALKKDINLIVHEINSTREVPAIMDSLKGKIDAFWMMPDTTVISSKTINFLLLFSVENKIPVFACSEKFVKMGALLSLNIDPSDIGRQAGEMAKKMISGENINSPPETDPRKVIISINQAVAGKLGIPLSDEIIKKAIIVR